uniref:Condensin complex subunit 3 n=1 Tax=Haemonchus contortus TaxID=6289 RepID=A0A6F7P0D8_HAECO|nr:Protein R05H10.3, isoform a [Haemonchus contortus]
MVNRCTVIVQLNQLFERCATIEELPHSFDDTLLDGLIDSIDLNNSQLAEFVVDKFSSLDFDSAGSVVVSIIIRLYEKYCRILNTDDDRVAEQLGRSEALLEQCRPPKVLSDLFSLYTTCHHLRQQCDWQNVIFWSVCHLADEGLTIFVRRKIEDFLCETKGCEVDSILPSVVDLFCCTDSAHVSNGTARILLHFADRLDRSQTQCIIKTVQSGGAAGDVVYQLAARARPDMTLSDDLAPNKWSSETARSQTIMKLVRSSPKRSDLSDLLATVFLSPCVKLSMFVNVIELLDGEKLKSYLMEVCRFLLDRRRSPLSDLQEMLSKLSARLDVADLAVVLDRCFPRLLESPCLIEAICDVRGQNCLSDPAMTDIRDRLALEITKAIMHSDWEVRDTALEIAAVVPCFRPMLGPLEPLVRSDPSPYVRAAALRCLISDGQYHRDELPLLCENVVLMDADAEPRLVAIQYLHRTLKENISHAFRILPKAIEDNDMGVRSLMVEMCSSLLLDKKYAEDTTKELGEWTEDPEIGAAVRAILGEPPAERSDPVEHILADMMNTLRIRFEDTMDCY